MPESNSAAMIHPSAFERELLLDAGSSLALEAAHQRSVEEHQIGHGENWQESTSTQRAGWGLCG